MDTDKKDLGSKLAYAALDEVPSPKADAKEIVGLVKSSGRITGYQLSDGSTVSKEEGVAMAKEGDIQGVGIAHRKDSEYIIGRFPYFSRQELPYTDFLHCRKSVCKQKHTD